MSDGQGIEAYDSAYPGSMCERKDGSYIRREDANSLANALLALIKSGDRAAEDLQDALDLEKRESADRIAALEAKVRELETSVSWYSGRHEEDDKIIDGLETELTASRQQVERLVEALTEICKHCANPITQYGYGTQGKPWVRLADFVFMKSREALSSIEQHTKGRKS